SCHLTSAGVTNTSFLPCSSFLSARPAATKNRMLRMRKKRSACGMVCSLGRRGRAAAIVRRRCEPTAKEGELRGNRRGEQGRESPTPAKLARREPSTGWDRQSSSLQRARELIQLALGLVPGV